MSYFVKVDDYQTYSGHDSEFHYEYNANSGGGQAFLGGKIIDTAGIVASPSELEGLNASFALRVRDSLIDLSDGGNASYIVSPRGAGSQSMKLGVHDKVNPNLLMAAAFMLPKTCGRNMAASISVSPLTTENYWLRSMWLDVDRSENGVTTFIPKDFVFEGGLSKRPGVTAQKDAVTGDQQFFKLEYARRIEDTILLADDDSLPDYALDVLRRYRDVYLGVSAFNYQESVKSVSDLMRHLSFDYSDTYTGYSDPLVFLANLSGRGENASCVAHGGPSEIRQPRNFIFFGAPGTGKSFQLNKLANENFARENICRVTFYPDYTYAQFVGCFKPFGQIAAPLGDEAPASMKSEISYRFVPGPFLDVYMNAVQNPDELYLLIIEEINRANPASVFGDLFQLLDRSDSGRSEYDIAVPAELREYFRVFLPEYATSGHIVDPVCLLSEQGRLTKEARRLSLPPNLYLWATMNSADQGVFPMDTAFRRRWDFRYIGINEGDSGIADIVVEVGKERIFWNELRRNINDLMKRADINEDKMLGPYFVSPAALKSGRFADVFKEKVLLYLFEDAGKLKRKRLFADETASYSELCEQFDEEGVRIFKDIDIACMLAPAESDTEGFED